MLEAFDDAFSKYATKHHSMAWLLRKTIVRQHESAAFARIRYHKENRRVTVGTESAVRLLGRRWIDAAAFRSLDRGQLAVAQDAFADYRSKFIENHRRTSIAAGIKYAVVGVSVMGALAALMWFVAESR